MGQLLLSLFFHLGQLIFIDFLPLAKPMGAVTLPLLFLLGQGPTLCWKICLQPVQHPLITGDFLQFLETSAALPEQRQRVLCTG